MINSISINNMVICKKAMLNIKPGYTALTGISGAGKSIIIDAISTALGSRSNYSLIMRGQDSMSVVVTFDIRKNEHVIKFLKDNDLDIDNELVIKRVLKSNKTNVCYVQGERFNSSKLKELSKHLVHIHSQNSHAELYKKESYFELLDSIILPDFTNKVKSSYVEFKELDRGIKSTISSIEEKRKECELNEYYLKELNELDPVEDEYDHLVDIAKSASNKERTLEDLYSAQSYIENNESSMSNMIGAAINKLTNNNLHNIENAINLLESAKVNIDEAISEIESLIRDTEENDLDIDSVNNRINTYQNLARKHGIKANELHTKVIELENMSGEFSSLEANLSKLNEQMEAKVKEYAVHSNNLHSERIAAAHKIQSELSDLLPKVELEKSELRFDIKHTDKISVNGGDDIDLLFRANLGQDCDSISKVASGGEISRISLCLQLVLSKYINLPTLVFDEVDVGISGSAATAVGDMFKTIGKTTQIITVTHQATVAAFSDNHLLAKKIHGDNETYNDIREISDNEKINEIALMMTGNVNEESFNLAKRVINNSKESVLLQAS